MDECFGSLRDAKMFFTLDANSSYWQIEAHKSNHVKTAFTSLHGIWHFKRMSFGLCNAPAPFQRVMDVILSTVKWHYGLVYLNDIVVFSWRPEEHVKLKGIILQLVKHAGVTLEVQICPFFTNRIDYLRHIMGTSWQKIANHDADTIRELEAQITVIQLQFFWGLCKVFIRFVPNFVKVASPLSTHLPKRTRRLRIFSRRKGSSIRYRKIKAHIPTSTLLPKAE